MRSIFRSVFMALSLLAGLGIDQAGLAQPAPDPTGDWNGALQTPQGSLTLIISISRGLDGTLKAELESPDQAPGQKIPVTSIKAEGGELAFEVAPLSAKYKGSWVAADQAWNGTFTQGGSLPLKLAKGLPPAKPVVAGLDGTWSAKVTRNSADLRLILRVATGPRGTVALFDSPDQLAYGLPVQDFVRDGQKVRFKLPATGGSYEGTLSDDQRRLTGSWTQGGVASPVDFTRSEAGALAQRAQRPQTPRPPFPYLAEEVAFENPTESGVHLAGTLTLPRGKGPFPAAIMITGSGQQDRDETILGHKPFAVIADHLSRKGIAVLRVDDRGMGKSTGDVANATSADFATDSNAAFAYLRTRKDINPKAIGFIGHSEGGMIGPIAMATNKDAAFLIMMAGPGTDLVQLMLSQRRLIGASMGQSEAQMNRAAPVFEALFKALGSGATYEDGLKAARAVLTPEAMASLDVMAGTNPQAVIGQLATPWFRYFFKYDPAPNLRAIKVPVLAMGGSLDRQVPPKENLAAIKAALKDNKDATVIEVPNLNHLFQTAKTGAVGEYADIEETVAPVALERMADWINARFGVK